MASEMVWEPDRLHQLDRDMERLDTESAEVVVASIVERYRNRRSESPLWQLVQDIRRQAGVHSNIIEQLKSGKGVSEVRKLFHEQLGLVSGDEIPNPRAAEALEKAYKKVSSYGTTLVIFVRDFGQQLLRQELDIGTQQYTATLEVQLGLTGPSLTLGTTYTGMGYGTP